MVTPYYSNAGVTIYHADCREMLPTISCDLLLADPPYGDPCLLSGGAGRSKHPLSHMGTPKRQPRGRMVGNDVPFNPAPLLVFKRVVLWGANHYANRLPSQSSWLVWEKREQTMSDCGSDCELAWTNLGGPVRRYSQLWRGLICRGEENGKPRLHPTQKPVALMRWCIERANLAPNSLVLDPYIGSGTTLIAAYRMGHRAIGIEIEERYCEIAARRLAQGVLPLEFSA